MKAHSEPSRAPLSASECNPGTSPLRGRVTLVLVAVLVALLTPFAAHAEEPGYPLQQKPTDLGVHTVIIEAPAQAFGLRKVAADYDRRLAGVDIWAKRGIVCDPDVTCIRVTIAPFGAPATQPCGAVTIWAGCAQIGGTDPWLWMNSSYSYTRQGKRALSCHELGHALGLPHLTQPGGCMNFNGTTTSPSDYEIGLLEGLLANAPL